MTNVIWPSLHDRRSCVNTYMEVELRPLITQSFVIVRKVLYIDKASDQADGTLRSRQILT
jgi:hypothetical protein